MNGSYGMALKLSKVIAQLPATILGSKRKDTLKDIDIVVVKEQASLLKHIDVNGTLPSQTRP